jgi:hypothetical protein
MGTTESSKSIRISRLNNADENVAKSGSTLSNQSDFKRNELNKTRRHELRDVDMHGSTEFLLHNKYNYGQIENNRLIAVTLDNIESLSLETSIYISAIRAKSKNSDSTASVVSSSTNHDLALLSVGDRIVSINGFSLANKSLLEIRNLFANFDHFNMVIEKRSSQMSMSLLTLNKSLTSVNSSNEKRTTVRTADSTEQSRRNSTTPSPTCDEGLSPVKTTCLRSSSKSNRFKYPLSRFHVPPIYTANHAQHGLISSTSDTSDERQQQIQYEMLERQKNKANYELEELINNFRQCNKERNLMDKK